MKDRKNELTKTEWRALTLTVTGMSDTQAYKETHPNASDKTAQGGAYKFFKRAREKLTQSQYKELFDLEYWQFYKALNKALNAETTIFHMGQKIAKVPDNVTRFKALELLGKMLGVLDDKDEGNTDSKIEIVFTDRTKDVDFEIK